MWALIRLPWMVYALNIWVSLFSIISVSQGWLVASNLFDAREAKRLYPLLGMAMVLGAAFGGEFTNRTAEMVGTRNLMLACAAMVILAYIAFALGASQAKDKVGEAKAGESQDFSFSEISRSLLRVRHLQVIIAIMVSMYLVDTLVEYQFQVTAKAEFHGDQLTAFFGHFYGLYLNVTEFIFQLFLTAAIVRRFGVGGTLQISPSAILLSSVATVAVPGLSAASAVRLTEASTRYTLNRTGMELLYMPLPRDLRNRVKAFIDICVDRLSRGLGGVLLIFLTATLGLGVKGIAVVVMVLCAPWMYSSYLARKEYIATIRSRFQGRRLDFAAERISVQDRATVAFLEDAALRGNPRQASYALGLLAESPLYDVQPLLDKLAGYPAFEVRQKVYEVAGQKSYTELWNRALGEIRDAQHSGAENIPASEVSYAIHVAPDPRWLARELLEGSNLALAESTVEALRDKRDLAEELITRKWLDGVSNSQEPRRRALAAVAVGVRGDQGTEILHQLLEDPDLRPAVAACRAAGVLKNRSYVFALIQLLGSARLRGEAISALAGYGEQICGALSDILLDQTTPMPIRRQIPRVLKSIPHQRAVDVLIAGLEDPDLSIRSTALKALNRLRETADHLQFDNDYITEQILKEARHYYELSAAVAPFNGNSSGGHRAVRLLAGTLEDRLKATLERLFRLLGLRYQPREIYSAYLAVSRKRHEESAAALEFLDNLLERDIKRILLPLFDAPDHLLERGRELFGVQQLTAEQAIRELIGSRDPWLTACAMAAAAELGLRNLAPEIERAAQSAEGDVGQVARAAQALFAA
jgi:HEAT repeat protein